MFFRRFGVPSPGGWETKIGFMWKSPTSTLSFFNFHCKNLTKVRKYIYAMSFDSSVADHVPVRSIGYKCSALAIRNICGERPRCHVNSRSSAIGISDNNQTSCLTNCW